MGRGNRVYLDAYKDTHDLYAVTVSTDGALALGEGIDLGADWSSLLDAKGDDVLVQSGGQSVAHYSFLGNIGQLVNETPVMAAPTRARFGENQACLVMGYSGIVRLSL
jgi:hypothetical protein